MFFKSIEDALKVILYITLYFWGVLLYIALYEMIHNEGYVSEGVFGLTVLGILLGYCAIVHYRKSEEKASVSKVVAYAFFFIWIWIHLCGIIAMNQIGNYIPFFRLYSLFFAILYGYCLILRYHITPKYGENQRSKDE